MLIARAPFRVSFAGGGSDLRDYYSNNPGLVISATINKYMYIVIHPYFHDQIRIKYSKTEDVSRVEDIQHPIVRECLKLFKINQGLEITSFADVPAGTGLGSSSSFTVALLHALHAYKGESAGKEQLAREACEIEINKLGEPIGKQDQYAAAYGGFNQFKFNPDESVEIDKLDLPASTREKLARNLILFFVGKERQASAILSEQKANLKAQSHRQTIQKMVRLATDLKKSLLNSKLDEFGTLLHEGWQLKKTLAAGISDPQIDNYYALARKSGALGGKILGAGGGGFLLVYCPEEKQAAVRKALGLRVLDFNFEDNGAQVILDK